MLKAMRLVTPALVLCALVLAWTTATAQHKAVVDVKINTFPVGASAQVDGKPIGNTPLTLNLNPGTHTFQFSLPGFVEKVETRDVNTTSADVLVILEAGPDFVQLAGLAGDVAQITWASNGQQVRFAMNDGRRTLSYTTYDLDKKTSSKDTPPVDTIEDATLRSRLRASSALYKSPSGRYIGYVSQDTSFLTIADITANRALQTNILGRPSNDALSSSFQLVWSLNETAIWVNWLGQAQFGEFVFLQNGEVTRVFIRSFKTEAGEEVYVDRVLAPPSEGKLALIIAGGGGKPYVPWLVDLQSMTGKPLPIDGIFDAGFASTGKSICVVHKGGISRVSTDLKSVELVSDVVSARWGVHQVSLSPTANYAIVGAGGTEAASFWIYKMPSC